LNRGLVPVKETACCGGTARKLKESCARAVIGHENTRGICGKVSWRYLGNTSEWACWSRSGEPCWLKFYEESTETHFDSSSAVNLCNTIIVAPQFGQYQTQSSEATGRVSGAAGVQKRLLTSVRQRATRAARGNGHPVGVAAQIAQHLQRTAKGRFGVDHPVLAV